MATEWLWEEALYRSARAAMVMPYDTDGARMIDLDPMTFGGVGDADYECGEEYAH